MKSSLEPTPALTPPSCPINAPLTEMPGKQSEEGPVEAGASEDSEEEGLGGLTLEELQQGQEAARVLEDMMALSAQTLVRAEVDELYEEVRPLGQGRYGRVLLVTHRQKGTPLALKQLPKPRTSLRGFLYEFCVGLSLGVHSAIVTAYGIGIESAQSYSFLTEPVLHGDLMAFIQPKVRRQTPSRLRVPLPPHRNVLSSLGRRNHSHCVGPPRASPTRWRPLTGPTGLVELLGLFGVHRHHRTHTIHYGDPPGGPPTACSAPLRRPAGLRPGVHPRPRPGVPGPEAGERPGVRPGLSTL
nr:serine/threonine-protein kinase SBK2 isoform X4 [Macaca nemestrina]